MEGIAKNNFSQKSFFMDFGVSFLSFFEALEQFVWFLLPWKQA